ncbi:MAG: phosphatase PAP2 family protein [Pseudomonadota bacterium]
MRLIRSQSTRPYDLLPWLALAAFTVFLSRYSNIDWQVASYFHGPSAGGFPLRNDELWLAAHSLTRQISMLLWLMLLAFTAHRVRHGERTERVQAGIFILLASAIALAVNGLLKTHSVHSCPWSLSAFGGKADFFRLLDPLPANPGSGGCLPSGHAAVGFMWWPVVYACIRWRPSLTAIAFAVVIAFGAFCGLIQIMRGAHFVSHVLMTAAVTGGCTSLTFHLCLRAGFWQRQPAPAQHQE